MRITYEKKSRPPKSRQASQVRRALEERGTFAFHLIGSAGSGRTSLIERTSPWCRSAGVHAAALVGAPHGRADADRLEAAGLTAIPIVTGRNCRLTAANVLNRLGDEELFGVTLLFIENVGGLVCPAAHDLGESARVVLLSVPEGDDKPLKYRPLFERADLVVITKIDMLEHTSFDRERATRSLNEAAPGVPVLCLSCRTGEGFTDWTDWLGKSLGGVALPVGSRRSKLAASQPSPF